MLKTISKSALPILVLPRAAKRVIALAVDASLCILTVWFAFYLRLGEFVTLADQSSAVIVSLCVALPIFIVSGLYRAIFRYAGWPALVAVARAIVVYGLIFAAIFTAVGVPGVPRTIGLIQPMLLLFAIGGSRAFARYWLGGMYQGQLKLAAMPKALIYGAGTAGRQLALAMANSLDMRIIGFLDDDERLQGQVLNGLPIYSVQDLPGLIDTKGVTDVLLALPTASRKRRNEILNGIVKHHVAVRTLPALTDLVQGKVTTSDLRDLDIDDLLGREPVAPDEVLLGMNVRGKVVLVSGAGGSIGSELCRQILRMGPAKLLLIEISEFALYAIHSELESMLEPQERQRVVPLLASVRDADRMGEIMAAWHPHTVYHAAAYKHVPLVEHNPAEGIRNNVLGTLTAARCAAEHGVSDFVLISTDKAVRPTNIMGASKRLAEMVLQALAALGGQTKFSMVRFGNVLGSSGSVVPKFRQQIRAGGPITLTHPDITRYFMTIPEAAQLVIQAGAMGRGGDVFVLDMGQCVRIQDLARRMVELSGLSVRDEANPEGEIEIKITGLRPGEKLYEELLIGDNPKGTEHPRIMKAQDDFLPWPALEEKLNAMWQALDDKDVAGVRVMLEEMRLGYQPQGEIVDWIYIEQLQGDE
ncbi:polysaccharide biosynthesis protein [Achromobacter dolens]|uniref:polysaccharide biosynthesis protein n=2 Tax=Bacteria TaxID=2 RepID=UPI003BA0BFB2